MQGIIDRGKYKIAEILCRSEGYEACLCVDVTKNDDRNIFLFNIYNSKQTIREYLPMFYAIQKNNIKDFIGIEVFEGSISAIFKYYSGEELTGFFEKHKEISFDERLEYADSLLSRALELELMDNRLACCALKEGSVVIDKKAKAVHLNFPAAPESLEHAENISERLGYLISKMFVFDRLLPEEIMDFTDRLIDRSFGGCVEIYSQWRKAAASAPDTRREYEKESFFKSMKRFALRKEKMIKKNRNRSK